MFFFADLIQTGGGEESGDNTERRQKRCDNISDFNKLSLQGGHKGMWISFQLVWFFYKG